MSTTTPCLTPLPNGLQLHNFDSPFLSDHERFHHLVGQRLYMGFTRPDITYEVHQLSQHLQHPLLIHRNVALHLVRFLKGIASKSLFYLVQSSSFLSKGLLWCRLGILYCNTTLAHSILYFPWCFPYFLENKEADHYFSLIRIGWILQLSCYCGRIEMGFLPFEGFSNFFSLTNSPLVW